MYERDAEIWMNALPSGVYHGHEGVRAVNRDIIEALPDWSWNIREIADGGDRIAIRADFAGYGRSSGAKTDLKDAGTAMKFSARGLVAWQGWFNEQGGWEKALEAVGLSA
jgi:predicted ester cyclase